VISGRTSDPAHYASLTRSARLPRNLRPGAHEDDHRDRRARHTAQRARGEPRLHDGGRRFHQDLNRQRATNATLAGPSLIMVRAGARLLRAHGLHGRLQAGGWHPHAKQSLDWLALIKEELGDAWLRRACFASGRAVCSPTSRRQLWHNVSGHYSAATHHPMALSARVLSASSPPDRDLFANGRRRRSHWYGFRSDSGSVLATWMMVSLLTRAQLPAYFGGELTKFSWISRRADAVSAARLVGALRYSIRHHDELRRLAAALGNSRATRAVRSANGRNPISIIHSLPPSDRCDGSLTARGGMDGSSRCWPWKAGRYPWWEIDASVAEIFETMAWGPAPEAGEPALAWLDQHGGVSATSLAASCVRLNRPSRC